MSDLDPRLLEYRRIRPIQIKLGSMAAQKLARTALAPEARLLGLWRQGVMSLESDEEFNVLVEHLVHDGHGGPTTPMELEA